MSTSPFSPPRPAVFLDKDGTLVRNLPYNVDPQLVELASGAGPALARLSELGFLLIVVSNQPGIADGRFDEKQLFLVKHRINELLRPSAVGLDGFYFCPHAPGVGGMPLCACRKPMPGMLLRAAGELNIDLSASWLIGDILDDIQAGRTSGVSTILLVNGGETEWRLNAARLPHYAATDLPEACSSIELEAGVLPHRAAPPKMRQHGSTQP